MSAESADFEHNIIIFNVLSKSDIRRCRIQEDAEVQERWILSHVPLLQYYYDDTHYRNAWTFVWKKNRVGGIAAST